MNQSFKKKAIVVSLASAFAFAGAGFVSVPGFATMSVASANQFEDTTQVATTAAGVTVPVNAAAALSTQTLAITETVAATSFAAVAAGKTIVLQLDNGKWCISGCTGGANPTLAAVGFTLGASSTYAVDSTGKKLTITLDAITAGATAAGATLKIGGNIVLDTSAVAVGTAINVSVASTSTLPGLTTGTATKLATTSAAGVTITNPTAIKAAAGATATLPTFSFTEAITGSVGTTAGAVKLELKNGYTWGSTKPTLSVTSNTGDATLTTADGTATGSSTTVASYKLAGASTGTAKTAFTFSTADIFVAAGATSDIVGTLTVLDANQNALASQDITLGNVVAKGLTSALSQASGQTGTDILFTGRNYTSSALTKNLINIKENVGNAVTASSTLTLTLGGGATWTSDGATVLTADPTDFSTLTPTTAGFATTFGSVSSTNKAQASYSAGAGGADASAYDGKVTISKLSTVGAAVGDLTLTVGSNSAAAASALKIADIKNATSASVSGTMPTVIPGGAVVALPDVVIVESSAGALVSGGQIALRLPAGTTYDSTVTPTVTVTKADGTALTGKATANGYAANSAGTSGAVYNVSVAAGTSGSEGPMTIKVSGLKVTASSTASAGDLNVYIHGNDSTAATTTTEETMTSSDSGAKPTSSTVKVATVVAATNPAYPTVTVSDSTKAVITAVPLTAAGNDQGKPGSVYVAFIAGSQVYFMNSSQQWTAYTGTTPAAYYTGNLSTTSIDVLKTATDLSSLKGGQLVIGYGLGLAGLSNPFDEMLRNSRYSVVYTVQ